MIRLTRRVKIRLTTKNHIKEGHLWFKNLQKVGTTPLPYRFNVYIYISQTIQAISPKVLSTPLMAV